MLCVSYLFSIQNLLSLLWAVLIASFTDIAKKPFRLIQNVVQVEHLLNVKVLG